MKNLLVGMLVGVFVSNGVWLLNLPPWEPPPISPADAPYGNRVESPRAAYSAIDKALTEGRLDSIRAPARLLARVFAPVNSNIHRYAVSLSESEDIETARRRFARLAQAFHGPKRSPGAEIDL
ncbi:MAG: hypothetical protein AAF654_05870 [Myxococcota bacterium]